MQSCTKPSISCYLYYNTQISSNRTVFCSFFPQCLLLNKPVVKRSYSHIAMQVVLSPLYHNSCIDNYDNIVENYQCLHLNPNLTPCDAIWRQRSLSTLVEVMARSHLEIWPSFVYMHWVYWIYNLRVVLKFDRHLGSAAAEVSVKFQSKWKSLNSNLEASRLHEILRYNVRPPSEY